jgi:hypothetical protein
VFDEMLSWSLLLRCRDGAPSGRHPVAELARVLA